nr:MAG TPA: hypothetical protein [Caudoviricetes sp.]
MLISSNGCSYFSECGIRSNFAYMGNRILVSCPCT